MYSHHWPFEEPFCWCGPWLKWVGHHWCRLWSQTNKHTEENTNKSVSNSNFKRSHVIKRKYFWSHPQLPIWLQEVFGRSWSFIIMQSMVLTHFLDSWCVKTVKRIAPCLLLTDFKLFILELGNVAKIVFNQNSRNSQKSCSTIRDF